MNVSLWINLALAYVLPPNRHVATLTVAEVAIIRVQCVNRTDARQEPCDDAQILFILGDGL